MQKIEIQWRSEIVTEEKPPYRDTCACSVPSTLEVSFLINSAACGNSASKKADSESLFDKINPEVGFTVLEEKYGLRNRCILK